MGIELSPTHLNVQATWIDLRKFAVIRFKLRDHRFSTRERRFKSLRKRYRSDPVARIGLQRAQQTLRLRCSAVTRERGVNGGPGRASPSWTEDGEVRPALCDGRYRHPSTPTPPAPSRIAGLLIKLVAMKIPRNRSGTSGLHSKIVESPPITPANGVSKRG